MVLDQMLYALDPFEWWKVNERVPVATARYTSNSPKVLGQTARALLVKARLTYTAPRESSSDEYLESGRMAEQLFAGFLTNVDDYQTDLINPSLRAQLAFYTAIRGFVCGLHVLTKNEEWETMPRIEAWDPFNTYWGRDHKGLAWACYYQDLDQYRMESRFGPSVLTGYQPKGLNMKDPTWRVYDYYDREMNYVMIGDRVALRQQHFGSGGRVPVTIVPVGDPMVVSPHDGHSYERDFGESIYAANREIYPKMNAMMSAKYARFIYMINPATKEQSRQGRAFIPQEVASPYTMGTRHRLSTLNEEDIMPLELGEFPNDSVVLEGAISGELQRGGFPHIIRGESSQTSSGYNTSLLMSSAQFVVEPRLDAMKAFYKSAWLHLKRQFTSGYFDPIRVQGQVSRQKPFDVTIEPNMIKDAPELQFDMRVVNAAEIAQKIGLVDTLRKGPYPLVDDDTLRDVYLEVEDPDFVGDLVSMQTAARSTPQTQLLLALEAAVKHGNDQLAQVLMGNLLRLMQPDVPAQLPNGQRMVGRGGMPGAGGGGGGGGGGMSGLTTAEGGSPRAGQPNPSDERQQGGRPREAGERC